MSEEFKQITSTPRPSCPSWSQREITGGGRRSGQGYAKPSEKHSDTTETLFITSAEQKLWEQLVEILHTSLWGVQVSGGLQGDSGFISFSGPPEVVSRAKEAVSKMLIMVSSLLKVSLTSLPQCEQKAAGFFQLHKGLHLYLWEGEPSRFRVDAVMRINRNGGMDYGYTVFAQRVWNQGEFLHINFDIGFSHPLTLELAAGAVKLALETASQKGHRFLTMSHSGTTVSASEVEAVVVGTDAFKEAFPSSPLKSINVVSGDNRVVAMLHKEFQKHWSLGKDNQKRLRNVIQSLENTKVEVVARSSAKKKTDVAAVPLVLGSNGLGWGPDLLALTQKVLETIPHAIDVPPGEILPVNASAFPEFNCSIIYLIWLEETQLRPKDGQKQAIRNMVRSCLSAFYGSFLESISFPVLQPADPGADVKGEGLLIILEEINHFLKEVPNTWMKLVQIVPLPGEILPHPVEDYVTTAVEPVGLCHLEDPLFLRYLEESPEIFHEFNMQLKKVGYYARIYSPWSMFTFQATGQPWQLHDLGAAFMAERAKYLMHCETRTDVLEALLEEQTFVKTFKSIKIYIQDQMWFVGIVDELTSFLQGLAQRASQRQLVTWECSADPLPRCTIAKDFVLQEVLPSNPLLSIEILPELPATARFWGRHQRVEDAARRYKELLNSFQVLPLPLSTFQNQFIKARWGGLFHRGFFLEKNIPAVLEVDGVVQVAGLNWSRMKEAEEIIRKLVCERTVEIAEELKTATQCYEWKELLHRLGCREEVAIHHVASNRVTVVGLSSHITQVEYPIKEYLRDNSSMEEEMELAEPELALARENILYMIDWKHLKVHVKLQPSDQVLFLLVSGLRKYVKEAVPAIRVDLDSLLCSTTTLKKKGLGEYFCRTGAGVLKEMAQQSRCFAWMKKQEVYDHWSSTTSSLEQVFVKGQLWVVHILGKENRVISLKQAISSFSNKFHEQVICHEAIATFSDEILSGLYKNIRHQFPVDLHCLLEDTLYFCGSQEDVVAISEVVHEKIEEYKAEWIEVEGQYETIPCIVVKECLYQKVLPASHLISIEILAENPATVVFRGPRQKVKDSKNYFEKLLGGFQVLPVSLSELQFQFVKAQWGELFHNHFFVERGILAVLEISEIIQIGALDLKTTEEAEEMVTKQVCERTVEIPEELKWATDCVEWQLLMQNLGSRKDVIIHHVESCRLTVVGLRPATNQVERSIQEYLRDNSHTEENMELARPELAMAGEQLLRIMNWEHLRVSIKLQPNGQVLSVQVSGLRKYVQEVIHVVKEDLDCLVVDTIPLKSKALGDYFSQAGAQLLQQMGQELDCTAWLQIENRPGLCTGGTDSNGNGQGLAEESSWAEIHAVGRKDDVASFRQAVIGFIAKFHVETMCSAELSTFSDQTLSELHKEVSHQFPVGIRRLKEKVIQVCGSQRDVENILGAIYTKIEEVFLMKMQRAQAEWIEAKLLYETVRWYHMTNAGWLAFDMNINRCLEMMYMKKTTQVQVLWDGQKIKVNLLKGEVFLPGNEKTKIKREICLWDKNVAPHWDDMDGCLVKRVELQTSSEEYEDVVKNFRRTVGNCKVIKVERIQNRYLWVSYCWKRNWMERKNPEGTQNERILYHGTQPENWYSIHEIGFKSACRRVGLYGQGLYFAVDASCSVFYAKPDPQGHQYMFQARVLTGEYDRGAENMVLPPTKQGGSGRYDSLVDVPSKPSLFVTCFDDHAYPEYLIVFRGLAT